MAITRLRGDLQLKQDSVSSDRIKDLTVSGVDLAPGSIGPDKLDFSVAAGDGLELNGLTNTLQVKVGAGLQINPGDQSLETTSTNDPPVGIGRTPGAVEGPFSLEVLNSIVAVGNAGSLVRSLSYGGATPAFSCYAAGGTEASPTNTLDGTLIGFLGAKGFDGTNFSQTGSRAAILMFAAEDFTPTAQGTFTRIRGTIPGTVSNKVWADFGPNDIRFRDNARLTVSSNIDVFLVVENTISSWLLVTENTTGRFHISENDGAGIFRPFTIEKTAPDDSLYITASGYVGIGTASPVGTLSVRVAADQNLHILGPLSAPSGVTMSITNDIYTAHVPLEIRASAIYMGMTGGNVGIGTVSPDAALHVVGTFRVVDGSEADGKVLKSDATGHSSWYDPAAVLARIVTDGENVLVDDDGNVIFTELS